MICSDGEHGDSDFIIYLNFIIRWIFRGILFDDMHVCIEPEEDVEGVSDINTIIFIIDEGRVWGVWVHGFIDREGEAIIEFVRFEAEDVEEATGRACCI